MFMNVVVLFIPLVLITVIASSLVKLFNFAIEQAIFITVCSITLLLIFSGIIGIMQIAFYLILAYSVFALAYLIKTKFDIKQIISPGSVGYYFGILIFIVLSRNCMITHHDEVVHWAYATKVMYYGDTFYKGLQAMFIPTFNYFITKTAFNFSESYLFAGSWILIWSCFLLPLYNTDWKHWKRAAVYMVAVYLLLGFNYGNVKLHIDEMMSYMTGAVVAYYAMKKEKNTKDTVIVLLGLISVCMIKDSFGAVTAMIGAFTIVVIECVQNIDNYKPSIIKSIIFLATPVAGYVLSTFTMNKPQGYLPTENIYKLDFFDMLFKSKTDIGLIALTFIMLVVLIIFIVNKKEINLFNRYHIKLYKIALIAFLGTAGFCFLKLALLYMDSLTLDNRISFLFAWEDFFYTSFGGKINKQLLALTVILTGFANVYGIKKKYKAMHTVQSISLYIGIFVYVFLVLIAFSAGFYRSGQYSDSSSWNRYMSVPIIMLLTYFSAYYILSRQLYRKKRHVRIILTSLILIIVSLYIPHPGIILTSAYEPKRYEPRNYAMKYEDHSAIINEYVEDDKTVFIVSRPMQGQASDDMSYGYTPNIYIKYSTAPIISNWLYDNHTYSLSFDDYIDEIAQYDYVYVHSTNNDYYANYGQIYPLDKYYNYALYKVDLQDSKLILDEVFVSDLAVPSE